MIFSNAIYLWGLLGLLLPIAIHLWSRKKVKTIKVGSTKLLEASEPKQTSSIKLNELWLLLLRLLTILLLVFILAEPSIATKKKNVAINYLVEASLVDDERMSSILDTIPKESVRILEKGFPEWNDYDFEKARKTPLYWHLAQQMESISADSIVVFSKGLNKGLKGKRPTIRANTRWIVIQSNETTQQEVKATDRESYAEVRSVLRSASSLSFRRDSIALNSDLLEVSPKRDSIRFLASNPKAWIALENNPPIKIGILENDSLKNQIQFFKAAYRGISRFINRPVEIEVLKNTSTVEGFDTLISFDDEQTLTTDGTMLIYQPDLYANQLIIEGPTKTIFHLTKLLDSENIVKEHLPEKLLKLLSLHDELKGVISSSDVRTVAENELQPKKSVEEPIKNVAGIIQISSWLWLVLILVVILERILSKQRKQ